MNDIFNGGLNRLRGEIIRKSYDPDQLEKGGEGSRGGKVIGHTKSGKPIYDHSDNKNLHSNGVIRNSNQNNPLDYYKDFTSDEHREAAKKLHDSKSNDTSVKSNTRKTNLIHIHLVEAKNKEGNGINSERYKGDHQKFHRDLENEKEHLKVDYSSKGYQKAIDEHEKAGRPNGDDFHDSLVAGLKRAKKEDLQKSETININKAFETLGLVEQLPIDDQLVKGGEGSRGGKVIGYTKSGKPIYDSHDHPSHQNFTGGEHEEAANIHHNLKTDAMKNNGYVIDETVKKHRDQAAAHGKSAKNIYRQKNIKGSNKALSESVQENDKIKKGWGDELKKLSKAFEELGLVEQLAINDELVKGKPGLTAKRVQIHGKDGNTYYAIRWVSNESGLSEDHSAKHPGYSKENGIEEDEQVHNIVNHPSMKPMEKVRKLAGLGIYDNKTLSQLSGHKYPSDIASGVNKEIGINYKDYHTNEKLPTERPKYAPINIDTEDGQRLAITKIAEMFGEKKAHQMQKAMKEEVQKELGLTVDDKWESYETDLEMLLEGELGLRAVMGYGTGGVGKALLKTEKVLTPYGFKEIQDIKLGDTVIGGDGKETIVVGYYPQGIRPVYRVTFKDGRYIDCDEDHLWRVKDRSSYQWRVLPLSEIMKFDLKKDKTSINEYRFGVPLLQTPFEYKQRAKITPKINPWLLGLLLGDGSITVKHDCRLAVGERDKDFILQKVQSILGEDYDIVYRGNCDYSLQRSKLFIERTANKSNKVGLYNGLTSYKLWGTSSSTKFIPEDYFKLPSEQRLELVRGLMDSDGYVTDDGFCQFTSTSKKLAEQFLELVYGLGARFGSIKEHDCNFKKGHKMFWEVTFMMQNGVVPVSLPFKLERIQNKKHPIDSLSITNIEYLRDDETICIKVDSLERTFVTTNFIVTHNTFTLESKILPAKELIEFDPELDMEKGGDEYDYVKIGGKIGSMEVQRLMYNHSNKILIFDDCDSMWNDDGLINVLKNALDTSGRGKTQWAKPLPESQKDLGDVVPSSFVFNGRMIFITNLSKQELAERGAAAVVESRCASTDLSMNMDQTMDRLSKIKDSLVIKDENRNKIEDVTAEDKDLAFNVFKDLSHFARIDQLNTRVLTQMIAKARYIRKRPEKLQGQTPEQWVKKQFVKQLGF